MSKIKRYIQESTDELVNKVSWPTASELQSSSIVVLVASILIAMVIFLMDISFENLMNVVYDIPEPE